MKYEGLEYFLKRKELFLERVVQKEGCWGWNGHLTQNGYARFKCFGKQTFAHVFSWMLFRGDITFKHFVCHKCDNPLCTNPDHLFLSKPAGNSADMVQKDRQAKGNNAKSILTENEVKIIKKRLKNGETSYRISKDFSVNMSTIYSIEYGRTWKNI